MRCQKPDTECGFGQNEQNRSGAENDCCQAALQGGAKRINQQNGNAFTRIRIILPIS
jgi:hypothetical protein